MKKFTSLTPAQLNTVRNSDDFKKISDLIVRISDSLQPKQIEIVGLSIVLDYLNILLADLLGYIEEADYDDFSNRVQSSGVFDEVFQSSELFDHDIFEYISKISIYLSGRQEGEK